MSAKVERKRTKDLKILLKTFQTYATDTYNDEDGADDVKIIGEMEKQPFEKFAEILRLQFPPTNPPSNDKKQILKENYDDDLYKSDDDSARKSIE